ncbi:hypothetical protein N0V93_009929 [Gnomoniopsis smithogilvyi]|uniref:Reticulon-like protein n=1 Tax=Gnomoniopsis smithogilvyi TaxID=1191159 RepID=A0A9W8YK71_9PEZI|nr:hypothetical protein N0V93_009929 [Gnomoniopsis smithogilvyi]
MAAADTANGAMDSLKTNAQSAYDSVAGGPVAQKVSEQHAKTSAELSNLAASRQTPANPAATGQPLTHYHSFFSELLSWKNPRASAIAYFSVVATIFAVRYLDTLRYGFKATWMVLGVVIAAEVAGKLVMNTSLASQLRPRRYYTIPRDTFDAIFGDVHELANFLVIESQRILFAENIGASTTVALSAFLSYWLVKIVPYWGLALLATTLLFTVPLVYTSNQELIDHHLKNAQDIVAAQTEQLRQLAGTHTAKATEVTKQYMGDYTSKAQELLRGRQAPASTSTPAAPASTVKDSDFPAAPKEDFKAPEPAPVAEPVVKQEEEPLIST